MKNGIVVNEEKDFSKIDFFYFGSSTFDKNNQRIPIPDLKQAIKCITDPQVVFSRTGRHTYTQTITTLKFKPGKYIHRKISPT